MIKPLEFKREHICKNMNVENSRGLETMIDMSLKYNAFDNTTYCTLYLMGLDAADVKVLAKYANAGYNIAIQPAHHSYDDSDDIELTVCYYY